MRNEPLVDLALRSDLVSQREVDLCILVKARGESRKPLHALLVERGYMKPRVLKKLRAAHREKLVKIDENSLKKIEDLITSRIIVNKKLTSPESMATVLEKPTGPRRRPKWTVAMPPAAMAW